MGIDKPTKWQLKAVFDKYQRMIRNPEYLSFCEREITFDENGFDYEVPQSLKACEIRDNWGLVLFFDPSRHFEPQDLLDVFEESHAVQDEWCESEVVYEEIKGVVREITNSEPIWDGHYIKLKINVAPNITLEQIKEEVVEYVKIARNDLDFEKYQTHHFDKRLLYYKIWDLRAKPLTFKKIAYKLNISEDKAKKNFQRAFELITSEKYNKDIWRNLIYEKLLKKAKSMDGQLDKSAISSLKSLLNLEETKCQEKLLGGEKSADEWYATTSGEIESFHVLFGINQMCSKCEDQGCYLEFKAAWKENNYELWNPKCSKLYKFLKEK